MSGSPGPHLTGLYKRLLPWYRRVGRDLPWRRTQDPYRIWVSEIMLQQTQVAAVIPYYERFIRSLPTVEALAGASLQGVLKLWEGMGYYARARNLHRAAKEVVDRWGGVLPADPHLLQTLPGVGRSTAGAIASLAYGVRAPILDGNIKRVLARLLAVEAPLKDPSVQQRLWHLSEEILPVRQVALFNQALMDLGATVCIPQKPSCRICPVQSSCLAFRQGGTLALPAGPKRKPLPHHHLAVAVIKHDGCTFLIRRPEKGLLGGLWGLPEIPIPVRHTFRQVQKALHKQWGIRAAAIRPLEKVPHTFTHLRITYHPFLCRYLSGRADDGTDRRWVLPHHLSDFPFSSATNRILAQAKGLPYPEQDFSGQIPRAAEPSAEPLV